MESLVPESNKKSLQELVNDGLNNHTDPQNVCRSKLGDEFYQRLLDRCSQSLIVDLDPTPLLDTFLSEEVLEFTIYRDIKELSLTSAKNREILRIFRGRGLLGYKQLTDCLKKAEQGHLVDTLLKAKSELERITEMEQRQTSEQRKASGRKTEGKEVTVIDDEDAEKWLLFEEGKELEEHIAKYGLKNIKDVLMKNLNGWKEKPLNIAVTGMSGKGKSSLINALRNMKEGDQGAAKVGEEECTTKCRLYPHPEHENFVFWDVPGAGTPTFPKTTYLDQIMIDRYDFFLIISSERFSEIDSWLANEIRKRNKRFYFVRTKIDQDMANIQRRMKENFQERKEFESLKMTIKEILIKEFRSSQFHFFMISNHHPNKYDFPFLLHQLLIDVPNEKKLAMVFGIAGMSKKIIEEKASALGSRIWKCALLSGAVAAIPIPFVSSTFDIAVILEEVLFYRDQFALDDDSLRHLANMSNISLKELKEKIKFKTPADIFTAGGLKIYMTGFAAGEVAEKMVQYTIPVLGIAIACGISFALTMTVLQAILEMMKQDAIDVLLFVSTQETAV